MLPDKLITTVEAAAVLAVAPSTVRALTQEGKLPVVRPLGLRVVRFRLSDIERLAGLRAEREGSHGAAAEQPA